MQIRNKNNFLSTVATTVVSALLVAGAVMGATTLSTNIETEGNLTVSGTAAITGATALTGDTTVTGALYANGGLDRSTAAALTIGGTNATSVAIGGAVTTGNIAIGSIQTTGLLTLGKITEEAIQIGGYHPSTDLYSIILAPKASVATDGIDQHHLVQITDPSGGSLFGDVGALTYGLVASFDRSVATTSDIGGTDTGFDLRVANDVANNAAYDIQGAYIKVTNSEESAASTVDVMKGLFVEALNETTATAGTVIGVDIGINSDGSETTATGLNIRNSGVSAFTDIQLQNDATITNSTADVLTVTEPTITLAGATKINLDGPVDLTGALVLDGAATGGLTTPLFGIGKYGTPKTFTPATADEVIPFQINIASGVDADADTTSLMGGYFGVANTGDMTDRQLQGIMSSVSLAKTAFAAYGVQGHIAVATGANAVGAAGASVGNIAGISGKVDLDGIITEGVVSAGLFTVEGAGTANTGTASTNGVWIDAVNTGTVNGLLISGTMTNGINMSGATISGAAIILPAQTNVTDGDACTIEGAIIYDGNDFFGCAGSGNWEIFDN
jgi:hypothetical protein